MTLTNTATACDNTGTRDTLVIASIRPSGTPTAMPTPDIQRVVSAPPARLAIIPQSTMTSASPRRASDQLADNQSKRDRTCAKRGIFCAWNVGTLGNEAGHGAGGAAARDGNT